MTRTIGIIAGKGQFPVLVARKAREDGLRVVAAGFSGFSNLDLAGEVDDWAELKLGQLGGLIKYFKKQGVERVVMAGSIAKPKALDIRPDLRALKLLGVLRDKGDDALLRAVARELEAEGMPVVPPQDILPSLLTPPGVLTRRAPTDQEAADLRTGWAMAKAVGRLDIGQCVVVRKGVVAAVEALEGTNEAIRRGGHLAGPDATVVKVCKPDQDERLDLPAVGLETIQVMAEAGVKCLGVEAGKSLFFDRETALKEADKAGICVVGVSDS